MEITLIFNILFSFFISIIIWIIIGLKWNNFREFFHKRYSYIETSFILIYFVEQILLSVLIYLGHNAQIVAGIFSIIIITTASFQNKCWESRTQKISEMSIDQKIIIDDLKSRNEETTKENINLRKNLEESKSFIEHLYKELKECSGN